MQCGENARECDKLALACGPREPHRRIESSDEVAHFAMFLRIRTVLPAWFTEAARLRNTTSQHGRALRSIRGRK